MAQSVELLHHSSKDSGLILTSSDACVEFACSQRECMDFLPHPNGVRVVS